MRLAGFFRKASYAVGANVLSLLVSVLTTLVVPRVLGVDEFGYFQLYIFYSSYVGLLHFGWNDGILLRLGGTSYGDLNRESVFSQFLILISQQFIVAIVVAGAAACFIDDLVVQHIVIMTSVCVLISGPMYMLLFILQATSRFKEFASIMMLQRGLFGLLVIVLSTSPYLSFELLIYSDLLTRAVGFLLAVIICREVIFLHIRNFSWSWHDVRANLGGGFPLMLSAAAGSLIIGVVRFGIAENWPIGVFGKVALSLSLASMVLTTIVAVGNVMFPFLRRTSKERLPKVYRSARTILSGLTLPALLLYFLLAPFISRWLPDYVDSAHYLGIIFPLFVYQVRTAILLEPYMKAMRKEKTLLRINVGVLLVSILVTIVCVGILDNLQLSLVSIVLLTAMRALAIERVVASLMSFRSSRAICLEATVIIIFLAAIFWLKPLSATIVLIFTLFLWFLANRQSLAFAFHFIKHG